MLLSCTKQNHIVKFSSLHKYFLAVSIFFFFFEQTHFHSNLKVYTPLEEVKFSNERANFATESAITLLKHGTYEKKITSNSKLK